MKPLEYLRTQDKEFMLAIVLSVAINLPLKNMVARATCHTGAQCTLPQCSV